MSEQDLLVPYAHDKNKILVSPQEAEKDNEYFCPSCGDILIFRNGNIKVKHFAHKASTSCSGETIIHKTAKLLIAKAVKEWKSGISQCITIVRKCKCDNIIEQKLPDKVDDAVLEKVLENGLIVDVGLISDNKPVAAVEIKATHAVEEEKASKLAIPFIELDANDVILNNTRWNPIQDHFNKWTCKECEKIEREAQEYKKNLKKDIDYAELQQEKFISKVAHEEGIKLIHGYVFLPRVVRCKKCSNFIIKFSWIEDGKDVSWNENISNKWYIPESIRHIYFSKWKKRLFVNICLYCGKVNW